MLVQCLTIERKRCCISGNARWQQLKPCQLLHETPFHRFTLTFIFIFSTVLLYHAFCSLFSFLPSPTAGSSSSDCKLDPLQTARVREVGIIVYRVHGAKLLAALLSAYFTHYITESSMVSWHSLNEISMVNWGNVGHIYGHIFRMHFAVH